MDDDDPSMNTGMFKAFVDQGEPPATADGSRSRLIAVAVAVLVIVALVIFLLVR